MATNWHVVNEIANGWAVEVVFGPGEVVPGKVIWHTEVKDMAVIELDQPVNRPSAVFATDQFISRIQPALAMGLPGAADDGDRGLFEVKITQGIVSAFVEDPSRGHGNSTRPMRRSIRVIRVGRYSTGAGGWSALIS